LTVKVGTASWEGATAAGVGSKAEIDRETRKLLTQRGEGQSGGGPPVLASEDRGDGGVVVVGGEPADELTPRAVNRRGFRNTNYYAARLNLHAGQPRNVGCRPPRGSGSYSFANAA
jgi:hypothetical protein